MNKKDNLKSLQKHRKQIEQMEAAIERMEADARARIEAKKRELDQLRELTLQEEQAEIMMLVQLNKVKLEDVQQMITSLQGGAAVIDAAHKKRPVTETPVQEETMDEEDTPDA